MNGQKAPWRERFHRERLSPNAQPPKSQCTFSPDHLIGENGMLCDPETMQGKTIDMRLHLDIIFNE
jgi:hypothetical protein